MANTQTTSAVLNPDGTLNENFKTQLITLVHGLLETEEVQYSEIVKQYVEKQLNGLENKLLNNEQWVKVKKNIEALLKVFDDGKDDGPITPEKVLSKFGEIQSSINNNAKLISDIANKFETNVKELTEKIATNTANINNIKDQVSKLQGALDSKAKDAAKQLTETVKTEVGKKIEDMNGAVNQIQTKITNIEVITKNTIDALAELAEVFKMVSKKIEERLEKSKVVFGLAEETKKQVDNQLKENKKIEGDGAVV